MITADNVRQLLASDADTVLILVEGRIHVVDPAALDTDEYRGALQVITRDELIERVGGEPLSDHELVEQADVLDMTIAELGA
ncbi:hypothetical protein [Mycobacterium sp. RTGN5]|uniref:hypothetical protein n=1 Tax=Mycobacterium sp. RTGN5 TaxID=3016522 RepID=UPI0029C71A97|nr:hypothetical protein [Mycobacterium sp. RTGN5]